MQQAISTGTKIYICEQSSRLLGMERPDFIEEGKLVGAIVFNDLAVGADAVVTF